MTDEYARPRIHYFRRLVRVSLMPSQRKGKRMAKSRNGILPLLGTTEVWIGIAAAFDIGARTSRPGQLCKVRRDELRIGSKPWLASRRELSSNIADLGTRDTDARVLEWQRFGPRVR